MRLKPDHYVEIFDSPDKVADLNAGFTYTNVMVDIQLAENQI